MEEEEEEVKDLKAENRENVSGRGKDADYGSLPTVLSVSGECRLTRRCADGTTQACSLLAHGGTDCNLRVGDTKDCLDQL